MHQRDHNPLNNDLGNLQVMTRAEHSNKPCPGVEFIRVTPAPIIGRASMGGCGADVLVLRQVTRHVKKLIAGPGVYI